MDDHFFDLKYIRRVSRIEADALKRIRWLRKLVHTRAELKGTVCVLGYWSVDKKTDTYTWTRHILFQRQCKQQRFHIILVDEIKEEHTHAGVLFIDTSRKTVERFDPDQPFDPCVDDFFEYILPKYGYKDYTYFPPHCIGNPQAQRREGRLSNVNEKSCQYWTLIYLYKRLTQPTKDPLKLLEDVSDHDFVSFINGIHRYFVLHEAVDTGLKNTMAITTYIRKDKRKRRFKLLDTLLLYLLKVV